MHRKKPENTLMVPEGVDAELWVKIHSNPEMAALLVSIAKTIKRIKDIFFCTIDGYNDILKNRNLKWIFI